MIVAFLLFAVVAAVTPGPSNIMLTAVGANVGIVKGLPCLFGVGVGMGVMMFLVSFGLGSLVLAHPIVLKILNWCGAGFLLWMAWKIATSGRVESTAEQKPVGFVGGAAFQWVNPKSWLVAVSASGTFLHAGVSPVPQSALIGALFLAAALPCCFLWLAFGATIQRFLTTARRLRVFNIAMAVLLALSIALVVHF